MEFQVNQQCALQGHNDRVWCVAWHPHQEFLVSCSGDQTIRVWAQKNVIQEIEQASLEEKGDIEIEENQNINENVGQKSMKKIQFEQKQEIQNEHLQTVRCLSFSPNGRILTSGSFDCTIGVWIYDQGQFEFVENLQGHENEVKSVSWDDSGKFLASCSRDKTVWVWQFDEANTSFEVVSTLDKGHTNDVQMVQWVPQSRTLVSCGFDDNILVWEPEDDDWILKNTLKSHESTVWSISFTPDGNFMASVGDDKCVKIWQKQIREEGSCDFSLVSTFSDVHVRSIYSSCFNHSGDLLATVGGDNSMNIFEVQFDSYEMEKQFRLNQTLVEAHPSDINCVAFHPKTNIIATCSDDRQIQIWEIDAI